MQFVDQLDEALILWVQRLTIVQSTGQFPYTVHKLVGVFTRFFLCNQELYLNSLFVLQISYAVLTVWWAYISCTNTVQLFAYSEFEISEFHFSIFIIMWKKNYILHYFVNSPSDNKF